MTTPWTTPTSFVNGVVIGATDLNQQVRDNMNHLKAPPFVNIVTAYTGPAQASTTATTAVPVTAGLSAALTTYGASVQVYFDMDVITSGTVCIHNLAIDGTAYTDLVSGFPQRDPAHYHVWITGLPSGAHVFVPTWRVATPGGTAFTNASAAPVTFWVREG